MILLGMRVNSPRGIATLLSFGARIDASVNWRDFDALESWARSLPHGGIEAIYDDVPIPVGLSAFAPHQPAHGAMFSARQRSGIGGEPRVPSPAPEDSDR
jgi:hypothetical protein